MDAVSNLSELRITFCSFSCRAKRGFSKILPTTSESMSFPAQGLKLRAQAQRLPEQLDGAESIATRFDP